jgi:uncharacterized protein (DUF1778 family)
VEYALDQLGFLQFERLVAELFELEAGIAASAWTGEADRLRSVVHQRSLGQPLVARPTSAPVAIQCVWVRAGERDPWGRLAEMISVLAVPRPPEGGGARSLVVVTNLDPAEAGGVPESVSSAGRSGAQVIVLGGAELCARIDARGELRRRVPSVLGLRDLAALIAPEVSARSSLELAAAQQLARVFVPTAAYQRAQSVLERHRFAVLTGPPEMGKTAIARMIGLAQMTTGWESHECVRPEDVWRVYDRDRAQVFIADDAFGSTEYRPDLAERWARELERILRTLDARHWLIWTSRPAPLRAALGRLHRERGAERFPAPAEVMVDAGALDAAEKTLILFRHAKAADLSPWIRDQVRIHGSAIVAHRHFTPERIRRLVATLNVSARDDRPDLEALVAHELARASRAMATSFAALGDEHRDLLIAMLDTPPGPVSDHDLAAALRRHHDGALSRSPNELVDRMADHFLRVLE